MKSDSENTNFNLRHLRAVHAIWSEGSFVRAAERLGVVPSALTETVQRLEAIAGGQLFDRKSRPPVPTPLGLGFLRETEPLLRDLDGALARLRDQARGACLALRIGAAPSAISPLVAPALARFHARHPDVTVTIHDDVAERLAAMVTADELDLAIAGRAQTSPDLDQTEIGGDWFGLACHRDHPLARRGGPATLAEIDPDTLVHLGTDTGSARLLASCPGLPARLRSGRLRTHSTIAQLCLVREGAGVALLPRNAVGLFRDPAIRFVEISDLSLRRRLYLLRPRARSNPMAEAFVEVLGLDGMPAEGEEG
ncbi:LysR family transcriptional regulator [Acidimangrovimonas sediminis]|uniref:LysR family transcriptional regulator n=1 Tax=Acidimangrovimonas sediminis TaxID=2056283 RepID=UPI000C8077D4|nr:LysR family transcriptional regulator [Acidimangrovimonas sediminis]